MTKGGFSQIWLWIYDIQNFNHLSIFFGFRLKTIYRNLTIYIISVIPASRDGNIPNHTHTHTQIASFVLNFEILTTLEFWIANKHNTKKTKRFVWGGDGSPNPSCPTESKTHGWKLTALLQNIWFLPHIVLLFLPLTGPASEQVKFNKLRFKCLPAQPKLAN
jgi:hypothetical protein